MEMEPVVTMGTLGLASANISFDTRDFFAQDGKTTDFFVATDSNSPVILATGGHSHAAWDSSHHIVNILCSFHTQLDHENKSANGIRVRINYVGDEPVKGEVSVTLAQNGAQRFGTPVKTFLGA
jgi:hypothetical protein